MAAIGPSRSDASPSTRAYVLGVVAGTVTFGMAWLALCSIQNQPSEEGEAAIIAIILSPVLAILNIIWGYIPFRAYQWICRNARFGGILPFVACSVVITLVCATVDIVIWRPEIYSPYVYSPTPPLMVYLPNLLIDAWPLNLASVIVGGCVGWLADLRRTPRPRTGTP